MALSSLSKQEADEVSGQPFCPSSRCNMSQALSPSFTAPCLIATLLSCGDQTGLSDVQAAEAPGPLGEWDFSLVRRELVLVLRLLLAACGVGELATREQQRGVIDLKKLSLKEGAREARPSIRPRIFGCRNCLVCIYSVGLRTVTKNVGHVKNKRCGALQVGDEIAKLTEEIRALWALRSKVGTGLDDSTARLLHTARLLRGESIGTDNRPGAAAPGSADSSRDEQIIRSKFQEL